MKISGMENFPIYKNQRGKRWKLITYSNPNAGAENCKCMYQVKQSLWESLLKARKLNDNLFFFSLSLSKDKTQKSHLDKYIMEDHLHETCLQISTTPLWKFTETMLFTPCKVTDILKISVLEIIPFFFFSSSRSFSSNENWTVSNTMDILWTNIHIFCVMELWNLSSQWYFEHMWPVYSNKSHESGGWGGNSGQM